MPDARTPQTTKIRLALICDSLEDNFQSALVDAAIAAATTYQVDLLVVPGGKLGDASGKAFVHDLVLDWVDGVIVAAHTIGHVATEQQMRAFIERLRPVPTVALGEVAGAECCLSIDNERAAYDLTQHLVLEHHLERFAYLRGPAGNAEARARERGFLRALREAELSLPSACRIDGDFTWEGGKRAVAELLDRREVDVHGLHAVICANDAMAVGACMELEHRGLQIPTDVAVVGFDDTEIARHLPAPLTTVRQPLRELLFDAVRLLVDALQVGGTPRGAHRYSAEPILRRSCGCPRVPNLPRPSGRVSSDAPGPVSLRAFDPAVLDEIEEAFVAALDQVRPGWFAHLLDALITQLEDEGTSFYDALEVLCFELLRARKPTSGWQQALLVLRRHVAYKGLAAPQLADLDRFIDGAMRLTSELTTSYVARQREELLEHLRVLSDATAGLLAAPDLTTIAEVFTASFPKLGVERGVIWLFASDQLRELQPTPLCVFGMADAPRLRSMATLSVDFLLRGQHWVVEPLGTSSRPLGVALLQSGLAHVSWYERLRDALTAAINGAQLVQQVQNLVVTDPLTGLKNRRYFTQQLRRELDAKTERRLPLSLLVLDLDGFKEVNDERGHDVGDLALIEAGRVIQSCLERAHTLARFGGDEFVAVLPSTSAQQARALAERVVACLPQVLSERVASPLTCSIGIATIERSEVAREADLFRLADQALLAAKRTGKNRVVHARDVSSSR